MLKNSQFSVMSFPLKCPLHKGNAGNAHQNLHLSIVFFHAFSHSFPYVLMNSPHFMVIFPSHVSLIPLFCSSHVSGISQPCRWRLPKSSSGQGGSSALRPDARLVSRQHSRLMSYITSDGKLALSQWKCIIYTLYVCVYDADTMCILCVYVCI